MYRLEIAQPLRYPDSADFLDLHLDAIDLTSRSWKVRFRQTFFQNEVQRVLYKLVLVTSLLDHSRRICSPSNFRVQVYSKNKKIRCVPITIILIPKINLEHLELLRPWGSQIQLPGGPRFT